MALREWIGGAIRKEMKERVDEVLKSADAWNKSADLLTAELAKLNQAITEGKVDSSILKPLGSSIKKLTASNGKLSKAFTEYTQTLKTAFTKLG